MPTDRNALRLAAEDFEALRAAAEELLRNRYGIAVERVEVDSSAVRLVTATNVVDVVTAVSPASSESETAALLAFARAGYLVAHEAGRLDSWRLRVVDATALSAPAAHTLKDQASNITIDARRCIAGVEKHLREQRLPAMVAARRRADAEAGARRLQAGLRASPRGAAQLFG